MSDLETDASPVVGGAEAQKPDKTRKKEKKKQKERAYQQQQDNMYFDDKGHLNYSGLAFQAKINLSNVQNLQIGSNNVMFVQDSSRRKRYCKATKPLSESTEELSQEQRTMISREVGRDWRQLGRELGLSDGQLDNIKADNSGNQQEASYKMVLQWQQENVEKATVAAMAKALDDINRGDIADKLH